MTGTLDRRRVRRRRGRAERARVAERVRAVLVESGCAPPVRQPGVPRPRQGAWVPEGEPAVGAPAPGSSPDGRSSRVRWNPGPRAARALVLAVLAIVAACAWWFTASHPREVAIGDSSGSASAGPLATGLPTSALLAPPASSGVGSVTASPSSAAPVVVDVAGKVRRPGVYSLPAGSRVEDALRAAGGVSGRTRTVSLNLAQVLADGEQIVVGQVSAVQGGAAAVAAGSAAGGSGSAPVGAPVDLNTASLEQLEALPGVGPATAQKILDWRAAHGAFATVDQLDDVSGIGTVRLEQLRPLVTV